MMNQRPEIRSAQVHLQQDQSLVSAARSQHLSILLESGRYAWNGFDLPLQSCWNIGATPKLPLFQGFSITGRSEAGKSTILKLILGLIRNIAGDIIVMNKYLPYISEDELNILR
jgi:ABC-type multidrug transport system fused ATPase/permease subunit